MPRVKTMKALVKALRKEGIPISKTSDVKIGDSPERCRLCKHETARPLVYLRRIIVPYCWIDICPNRPACRRRQVDTEAKRVRDVLEAVVI